MELKHSLTVSQQLKLSPRLYQSLKILRLNAPDLLDLIHKELDENPTLEMPEPSDLNLDLSRPDGGLTAEQELWRDLAAANRDDAGLGRKDPLRTGGVMGAADLTADPVTLSDHLCLQVNLLGLSKNLLKAAKAIIGSLDADGYLREQLPELAASLSLSAGQIEKALKIVQSLDPPGIAARSLEECLLIQLEQLGAGETSKAIVRSHLPQLARGAYQVIAKDLKVPLARVEKAAALIKGLSPSPGSVFDVDTPAARIIPDVYVTKQDGSIQILANREILPSLHISEIYKQLAEAARESEKKKAAARGNGSGAGKEAERAASGAIDAATAAYIRQQIRNASGLIRDINQRRATVTRVARAIMEAQPDFIEKGSDYLRPLALESVAARLEVHPSTVSRAILGKYMSTPHGIFEFRYFFSAGYACEGGSGKGLAATAVKKRLKKLVDEEDQRRPYSDQKLMNLLKEAGISISRRTVAKYREEMGIPPSWDRKQKTSSGMLK